METELKRVGEEKKRLQRKRTIEQVAAIAKRKSYPTSHRASHLFAQYASTLEANAVEREADLDRTRGKKMATGGRSLEQWAQWHRREPQRFVRALEQASSSLWSHQRLLADRILQNEETGFRGVRGGVLNEYVGNGKSRTVLHVILMSAQKRLAKGASHRFGEPTLIVAPKSLLLQWEDEIRKYYGPELLAFDRVVASNNQDASEAALALDAERVLHCLDIVLTSYDTLRSGYQLIKKQGLVPSGLFAVPWKRLVLDEGATIVNKATAIFRACNKLHAECRLLISATPLPNSRTKELNSILSFLRCSERLPEFLDEPEKCADKNLLRVAQELRELLVSHYILRVSPMAAPSGPTPLETTLVWTEFETEAERHLYRCIMDQMAQNPSNYIRWITKLREACISPVLLLPEEDRAKLPADRPPSTKIRHVIDYVRTQVKADEKALVFCDWLRPLEELGFHLQRTGISYEMLTGALSLTQRAQMFRRFNEDENPRLLLMQNRIGGLGHNLERANHVIQLSSHWSPTIDIQLNGRINRPGQTRPMHSIKFIMRNTIETAVLRVNQQKDERQRDMLTLTTNVHSEDAHLLAARLWMDLESSRKRKRDMLHM